MRIVSLFCDIDDFFLMYEAYICEHCLPREAGSETRGRPSEVMTLRIAFHQSNYRTFKHFYQRHVCVYWCAEFPHLVSYSRFVRLKKEVLTLLGFHLRTRLGECRGVSFVDSTRLRVCENRRIASHRVFAGVADFFKLTL